MCRHRHDGGGRRSAKILWSSVKVQCTGGRERLVQRQDRRRLLWDQAKRRRPQKMRRWRRTLWQVRTTRETATTSGARRRIPRRGGIGASAESNDSLPGKNKGVKPLEKKAKYGRVKRYSPDGLSAVQVRADLHARTGNARPLKLGLRMTLGAARS